MAVTMDSLKIGPVTYKVEFKPRLYGPGDDGKNVWLNGEIDYGQCLIQIEQEKMSPQLIAEVLWHEAVHGILEQAGQTEHSEAMVKALGYGLVQLVRDNPELIALTLDVVKG